MKSHMADLVEIKGFKGFEDFSLKDLKRVNLIGGKNNIGKTALMEALQLYLGSHDAFDVASQLVKTLERRQKSLSERNKAEFDLDFFYGNINALEIKVNDKSLKVSLVNDLLRVVDHENRNVEYVPTTEFDDLDPDRFDVSNEELIKINFGKEERFFPVSHLHRRRSAFFRRGVSDSTQEITFISSSTTDETQIAILYGNLVDANKEFYLNDSLSLFDESILALKQVVTENGVLLKLLTNYQEKPILLSSFGEGINRYIAILCAIWASKDGFLFIDEIENGIHYSNYPKLWKLIFEASKLANCQLFITTHSKECIETFNEQNRDDEGGYFELYRHHKTQRIVAKSRNFEQLDYALKHDGEIRGE